MAGIGQEDTLPGGGPPLVPADGAAVAPAAVEASWAARSCVGHRRRENQDRWGAQGGRRFVVADGMGGHAAGATAAALVRDGVLGAAAGAWESELHQLNAAVRAIPCDTERAPGSTLVLLDLEQTRATVVSVGDSRIYRWRGGRLEPLTVDHTVRGELLSAGLDADALTDARRGRGLTSYLGVDPASLRVDVVDVPVRAGDRFLLCSDGIHGQLDGRSIARALADVDVGSALDAVFARWFRARGPDDATAVLVAPQVPPSAAAQSGDERDHPAGR